MFAGAIELAKLLIPIAIATAIGCALVAGAIGAFDYWFDPKIKIGERLQASANLVGAALGGILGASGAIVALWFERARERDRQLEKQRTLEIAIVHSAINDSFSSWLFLIDTMLRGYRIGSPRGLALVITIGLEDPLDIDDEEWRQIRFDLHHQAVRLRAIRRQREALLKNAKAVLSPNLTLLPEHIVENAISAEFLLLSNVALLLNSISLIIRETPSYSDRTGIGATADRLGRLADALVKKSPHAETAGTIR